MKNMNKLLFSFDKYKDKIDSVTYLRLISFEIYKLIILYIIINIIAKLSNYFPFSFFYELNFEFYNLIKIFIYLLIVDICYYSLFISNIGQSSYLEIIISLIKNLNIIKNLSISISFCIIFLVTNELKSLMPRLNSTYIKNRYNIEPIYKDDYEENYYQQRGLTKRTIYENADNFITICASVLFVFHFIVSKQHFWTKKSINRISHLKNKIYQSLKNIGIIGVPLFFVLYILHILFYHTLFVVDISFNYTSLLLIEYNILYITKECLNNFICANINFICYEINSKEKFIKKEIDFKNEDNFYIIHHLQILNDIYRYPHDIKLNKVLLKSENLEYIKKKIYFFIDSINRKYSVYLSKKQYFTIRNDINSINNIKIMVQKIYEFFDFNANQIFENETCFDIIELIIKITGNIIIFIADAKLDISNEEKYMRYSDNIYFFIERLFDIDKILFTLTQNTKNSQDFRNDLIKLRIAIKTYFDLIKNRQNKCNFIKLETQNIQNILYSNY